MMEGLVKIWYVSPQRLCNFSCPYCVSVGDYAKSNQFDWRNESDVDDFRSIVRWLGSRSFSVGVRLATLGEPFVSNQFLEQTAWLTRQDNIKFVELLTNGSLLRRRLPRLERKAELSKLSLWITYHNDEISIDRVIDNACIAQEQYRCFVVLNALLFPGNEAQVVQLRRAARAAGLRFNLDLGYDPVAPSSPNDDGQNLIPILRQDDGLKTALSLGAHPRLMDVNVAAVNDVQGRPCAAGHRYFYIGINGDVYQCSRYFVLKINKLGNAIDPEFDLDLRENKWVNCLAKHGCCNKEDFLNRSIGAKLRDTNIPSLGWVGI